VKGIEFGFCVALVLGTVAAGSLMPWAQIVGASPKAQTAVLKLNRPHASSHAISTATARFRPEREYADITLRSQIHGRLAMAQFYDRAIGSLPNGAGSPVIHALGSD